MWAAAAAAVGADRTSATNRTTAVDEVLISVTNDSNTWRLTITHGESATRSRRAETKKRRTSLPCIPGSMQCRCQTPVFSDYHAVYTVYRRCIVLFLPFLPRLVSRLTHSLDFVRRSFLSWFSCCIAARYLLQALFFAGTGFAAGAAFAHLRPDKARA